MTLLHRLFALIFFQKNLINNKALNFWEQDLLGKVRFYHSTTENREKRTLVFSGKGPDLHIQDSFFLSFNALKVFIKPTLLDNGHKA